VIQVAGGTACHPGEANADYMLEDVYERDLDAGYHEKGSCVDGDAGCVLYDLFGGFNDRAGRSSAARFASRQSVGKSTSFRAKRKRTTAN